MFTSLYSTIHILNFSRLLVSFAALAESREISTEASPALGCSSEIARVMYVCVSVVVQKLWAELRGPNARMLKVNPTSDTRIIHFDYTLEQL